jgi:hypothetical protein
VAHGRRARSGADSSLTELAGSARGGLREAALSRLAASLHRVRGRGWREAGQEDGWLSPVPRGERGGERNDLRARGRPPSVAAEPLGAEAGIVPGGVPGDRRVGVVWHTQGSGKSLTMAFYAGRVILHPRWQNPTLVVITDRNDLDDQLFGTFARCRDLLRQDPVQAADRADLRRSSRWPRAASSSPRSRSSCPRRASGTRFSPMRRNIVVIADEAHRSQYDSSTASPGTCAMRCPTPRSSASPARRSSRPTPTRARCSATTSASTTSSAP